MKIHYRKNTFKNNFNETIRRWLSLPKHKRRNDVIKLKNDIRNWKRLYGTHFFSEEDYESVHNEIRVWTDIYFVSKKHPDILYNTCIITAQYELSEKIEDRAISDTYALLTKEEEQDEFENGYSSKPCEYDAWGRPTLYTMEFRHKKYPQLGDRTVFDHEQYLIEQYWKTVPEDLKMDVSTLAYKVRFDFAYGIGLTIIVDEPILTVDVLNKTIETFLQEGEPSLLENIPSLKEIKKDVPQFTINVGTADTSRFIYDNHWYQYLIFKYGSLERQALFIGDLVKYNDDIPVDISVEEKINMALFQYEKYMVASTNKSDLVNATIDYLKNNKN